MTTHIRTQIRNQVVSDLTGLTTTGNNVFASRMHRLASTDLPALLVYTLSEESGVDSMSSPRGLFRELDLAVEAIVEDNDATDDDLDTICKEVEAALGASTLSGLAKDVFLSSTDIEFDGEKAKKYGSARMSWRIEYRTPENDATNTR